MSRVIAIDPGYERLGIAILERVAGRDTLLHSECFITERDLSLSARMKQGSDRVEMLIKEYKPALIALERLYFNKNQRTAMGVAEVRGALRVLAEGYGCQTCEFTPQEVKVAVTGYGKSDKGQVARMLPRLLPNIPLKALDDEYDAIAVGVTALAFLLSTR